MGLDLEITKLAKTYNGRPILQDCSYFFAGGRTYTLQGSNGSGKSTLLRILALLEQPDAGAVRYLAQGQPLAPDLALRRRLTLVLPRTGIFRTTVEKNVAYGLKIRGVPAIETHRRVRQVLEIVGLDHKRHHQALELSSGEAKRLGIARAMVIEPEVFLLDEPTANLDPANTAIIEEVILQLRAQGRTTILVITHDAAQAERLGDRCLLMQNGALEKVKSKK